MTAHRPRRRAGCAHRRRRRRGSCPPDLLEEGLRDRASFVVRSETTVLGPHGLVRPHASTELLHAFERREQPVYPSRTREGGCVAAPDDRNSAFAGLLCKPSDGLEPSTPCGVNAGGVARWDPTAPAMARSLHRGAVQLLRPCVDQARRKSAICQAGPTFRVRWGLRPFSRAIRSIASAGRMAARTGFRSRRKRRFIARMTSLTMRVSRG